MLVIRLARVGRKNQASFRLVAAEKLRTPTGKFVAQLGHYNPHNKELVVDKDKLAHHFKHGAQPSSTVVKLLKRNNIAVPKWAESNLITKKKAPKAKKGAEEKAEAKPAGTKAPADTLAAEESKDKEPAKAETAKEPKPARPDDQSGGEKPAETEKPDKK